MRRTRRRTSAGIVVGLVVALVPAAGGADAARRVQHELDDRLAAPFAATARPCAGVSEALMPLCAELQTAAEAASDTGPGSTAGATLHELGAVVTPSWWPDLHVRDDGALVRIDGYGLVAVTGPDGTDLWVRSHATLRDEWGLTERAPGPAVIPIGVSVRDPFRPASERAFAVADITGDGVEDVIVSHFVRTQSDPEREYATFVSVLDGRDGRLRWHRRFDGYVTQVIAQPGTVVLGVESGPKRNGVGADGGSSFLAAYDVIPGAPSVLTPSWTFAPGTPWLAWLAAEPVGERGVAVASAVRGSASPGLGTLAVFDTGTGATRWSKATAGYVRKLRHDAGRSHLVVAEQADPAGEEAYDIALVDVDTGTDVTRVREQAALPLRVILNDLDGDGDAEVVVSDLANRPVNHGWLDVGRVTAYDGDDLSQRWRDARDEATDGYLPVPYALAGAGRDVAVGWLADDGAAVTITFDGEVGVLAGATGAVRWRERDGSYPLFLAVRDSTVLSVTFDQALHGHAATSGERVEHVPLLAHVHGLDAVDVDGDDLPELIAGTQSGGVFAIAAAELDEDPDWHWRTNLGAPVHEVHVADVTTDPGEEIVAVASTGVSVLRRDGSVVHTVSSEGQFAWTVTLADLDGDGLRDLVIPTRWLTAVRGADGTRLWRFPAVPPVAETWFSTPAVTSDGIVGAQMVHHTVGRRSSSNRLPNGQATQFRQVVLLDGANGVPVAQHQLDAQDWNTYLWRSAVAVPTSTGDAIALAYGRKKGTGGADEHNELVDARTGEGLWDVDIAGMGAAWATLARDDTVLVVRTNDITTIKDGVLTANLAPGGQDITFPTLTDGSAVAAVPSWTTMMLHDPAGLTDSNSGEILDEDLRYLTGRVQAVDADGDGDDEVIAWPFDLPAYERVLEMEGFGFIARVNTATALVIYDVR